MKKVDRICCIIGKTVPNRKGGILCIMVLSVRKKGKVNTEKGLLINMRC